LEGVNFVAKEAKKLFQAIYEMNSRQRWENQGATLFSGKPCQIITSNSGLFFDLSGEVSHTETAWMLGESDRLPSTSCLPSC
jgi:hypothetical protein